MNIKRKRHLVSSVLFFITSQASFGGSLEVDSSSLIYQPYLEIGGTRFFSGASKTAGGFDFFIPLWQSRTQMIFADARFYDRSGKPFEGNIHLGYRELFPEDQFMYGIYGAFDRKRSELGNYFNQLTFGGEVWFDKLFIGGNIYQPIGSSSRRTIAVENAKIVANGPTYKDIYTTLDKRYEKAMQGIDAQVGYELIKGLTGYVGGYYFKASDTNSVTGPKARLTYDWSLDNGKRILSIFDKIGLEVGAQRDQVRGTLGYVSANIRIGLMPEKNSSLQGVARHMVDLVRRDVDVVLKEDTQHDKSKYFCTSEGCIHTITKIKYDEEGYDVNGKNRKGWDRVETAKRKVANRQANREQDAEEQSVGN